MITSNFQLKGTLSGISLRDSLHDNTVRIAGKSHRAIKGPTDYENVLICYFSGILLCFKVISKSCNIFLYVKE